MRTPKRKEVAAYSLLRRIYNKIHIKTATLPKRMDLSFVTLNDQTYKRIKFIDNQTPKQFKDILNKFTQKNHFPGVFHHYENELWVEYIEGDLLDVDNMNDMICKQFAQLYSDLYKEDAILVDSQPYEDEIKNNLEFLEKMNIITFEDHQKLCLLLTSITPPQIWQGLDYTDALAKNFLLASEDKKLMAIDIESLQTNTLLGCGLAKALARWMPESHFNQIMEYIQSQNVPTFYEHMDFSHLYFRTKWLKTLLLRNKIKRLKQNLHLLKELA